MYLSYGLSDETSHHQPLCVDEQISLGLRGSAQSHLLETELVVSYASNVLGLEQDMFMKTKTKKTPPQCFLMMDLTVYIFRLTFLTAYLGSSGITRTIFPSQNSATTRSFFQPWKHNREKTELLQSGAKNPEQAHLRMKQSDASSSSVGRKTSGKYQST